MLGAVLGAVSVLFLCCLGVVMCSVLFCDVFGDVFCAASVLLQCNQAGMQAGKQAGRQAGRHAGRQAGRQAGGQALRQAGIQA